MNLPHRLQQACSQSLTATNLIAIIISTVVEVLIANPALYRTILYAALGRTEPSVEKKLFDFIREQMAPSFDVVSTCIDDEIRSGRFRKVNSAAAARLIIGAAIYEYEAQHLLAGTKVTAINRRKFSEMYAELLYGGLKP